MAYVMERKDTVYYSKVAIGLPVVILIVLAAGPFISFFLTEEWDVPSLVISGSVLVLVVSVIFSLRYHIEGDKLMIRCLFMKNTVEVKKITRITRTRSILSAPAASMDRICLYAGRERVILSPRRRADFLKELLNINPDIILDEALRKELI